MGELLRTPSSSLLNNMISRLRNLLACGWEALFPVTQVSQTEAFLLRALLAFALWQFFPISMDQVSQPAPVGLAHWFDLTWLANPDHLSAFRSAFLVVLFWFSSGIGLPLSLPTLALLHILPFTLVNSQGHAHHGYQIMSLTLIAMSIAAIAHAIRGLRAGGKKMTIVNWMGLAMAVLAASKIFTHWQTFAQSLALPGLIQMMVDLIVFVSLCGFILHVIRQMGTVARPHPEVNSWLLMSGQYMIGTCYFLSVVTKMVRSKGEWLMNSQYLALDFVKTMRQSYYNDLDPSFAHEPRGVVFLMQHENIARLFFDAGLALEVALVFTVGSRKLALMLGLAVIAMHETIKALMTLSFPTHEAMIVLFFINAPFLLTLLWQKVIRNAESR